MNKIIIKTSVFLLLITLISTIFTCYVQGSYIDLMKNEIKADRTDNSSASGKVEKLFTTIVVVVKIAGVAIAIIMLLAVGMKYMVAAPGDRADIKKSAVVYVVGAFILFAVSGILTLIQKFASVFDSSSSE